MTRYRKIVMNALTRITLAVTAIAIGSAIGTGGAGRIATAMAATLEPGTTEIALTHHGDSWWVSTTTIRRRLATGDTIATLRSDTSGLGAIERFAVSPQDASLWVVTATRRLVHVESDGIGVSTSPLPADAGSIAIAQSGDAWIGVPGAILHFTAEGRPIASHPLGSEDLERTTGRIALTKHDAGGDDSGDQSGNDSGGDPHWQQILVDSLREQIWVIETQRLIRFGLDTRIADVPMPFPSDCDARAAALDGPNGNIFILCGRALMMFDASGTEISRLALDDSKPGSFERLVLDPQTGELTVAGANTALRVGTRGGLERHGSVDPILATVHPAPFRIDPIVSLLRPPDGGATWNAAQELTLALGAQCPSADCEVPDRYFEELELEIDVDGSRQVSPEPDPVARRAVLRAGTALHPGVNRIDAGVRDRFGHVGRMRTASLTLLVPPADSGDDARTLVAKAANKPPAVALTTPVAASVFTTGSSITLSAEASDSDGSITEVDFYRAGSTLIGTANAPPYTIVWPNATAGSYSLTARAVDNRKGTSTSAPVVISVVDNRLPTVVITTPADGAFYTGGNPITLTADARDSDGSITRLEFLDGATTIAVLDAAPWTWTWSGAALGSHAITARATDDRGAIATSGVASLIVGGPPRVVIAAPAACAVVDAPINLPIVVDVHSASSTIASVDVYDGTTLVGSAMQAPWEVIIADAGTGTHSITARAIDVHGLSATSRPAIVEVRGPNQAPVVTVTSPTEGATFASGATVTLRADASDPDGKIVSVLFHTDGSASIGTVTEPPYQVDWSSPASGNYTVYARAVDDRNAVTTSTPVHFSVASNVPPTVSLTSPADGATFGAPATISLAASASDPDGAISRVEFYSGATLLATDTGEPFAFEWRGMDVGTYSLVARAYDNTGAVTASSPVSITVSTNAPPVVTLTSPAAGTDYYAPATITVAAVASDPDGGISRIDFRVDGILIGTASAAPYVVTWENVSAGTHSITATAFDDRGGVAVTPPLSLVVKASIDVNVDLVDGVTIDDDRVRIRGSFSGPENSSITLDGVVAHVDDLGYFHLNDMPLAAGANTIDVVITTQDGRTASHSVTVNSSGPGAFVVNASPTEGIGSLHVTFTAERRTSASFKQISFDLDGDGYPNTIATPAQFTDGAFSFVATYPVGTWNVIIKAVDDEDRVIYETRKSIVVLIPELLGSRIRAVYERMLTHLGAGNVADALTALTGSAHEKFEGIFNDLQPDLPAIVGQVGTIAGMTFDLDVAELEIVRQTPEGPQQFMVYLIRSEDGIWRVDGM